MLAATKTKAAAGAVGRMRWGVGGPQTLLEIQLQLGHLPLHHTRFDYCYLLYSLQPLSQQLEWSVLPGGRGGCGGFKENTRFLFNLRKHTIWENTRFWKTDKKQTILGL